MMKLIILIILIMKYQSTEKEKHPNSNLTSHIPDSESSAVREVNTFSAMSWQTAAGEKGRGRRSGQSQKSASSRLDVK